MLFEPVSKGISNVRVLSQQAEKYSRRFSNRSFLQILKKCLVAKCMITNGVRSNEKVIFS